MKKKNELVRNSPKKHHGVLITIVIVIIVLVLGAAYGIRKMHNQQVVQTQETTLQNAQKEQQRQLQEQHQRFISKIAQPAIKTYRGSYHVLPSIVIAQAILESDWGNSKLYQNANNPFGIKGSYKGQSISYDTNEYVKGKKITVSAQFRKYPDLLAAIKDHDATIKQHFIKQDNVTSYITAANLLQKNVYATDPKYAKSLISVIKQYKLSKYDLQALNGTN